MAIAVVVPIRLADTRRPVEIYARRRLMVLFVLAAIALVLLVGTGHVVANRGGAPASTPAVRPANSTVYVVQAGDTLWSIAERYLPRHDQFATIAEIRQLNGLSDYTIHPGQHLVLPGHR